MNILSIIFSAGLFLATSLSGPGKAERSCKDLGNSLGNRIEAIATIQNTEFEFEQSFETLAPVGVQKATFYSCGGNGYMVVKTNRRTELYQNVPQHVWMEWINSQSVNHYYHYAIRNNPQYLY